MDPDSSYQILILLVLVMFSAFFTASQTALVSLNKYNLRQLVSELNPRAILVNKLLDEPSRLFDTILLGDYLVNVAAIVLGTRFALDRWGQYEGTIYAIIILTLLVLIFGEMLPRVLAAHYAEKVSFSSIRVLYFLMVILYPLLRIFSFLINIIARLTGVKLSNQEEAVTEEEIISLVAAGQEEGIIHQEEKTMIHSVFDFTDTVVRDVMVPRPDIIAVEKQASFDELLHIIREEKFSRLPVYDNNIDNIIGVVHIKDLILLSRDGLDKFNLDKYLRQPFFVPETKKVNDLFKAMKKEQVHMAVVLDEYGSTMGLVTMEDLIEEIMGDIQDEHDTEEPELQRIDADTVEINASMRIDEFNEKLGLALECEEAETVGGLVFVKLDRVPKAGDSILLEEYELTVMEMDGHRIEKLRVAKNKQ